MLRLSTNADGPHLLQLAIVSGITDADQLDWSQIADGWLIAEFGGHVVGGVQLCPGRPIFRVEYLLLEPALSRTKKALVTKALCYAAVAIAAQFGASAVYSVIHEDHKGFMRVLERRGAIRVASGTMYKVML